MVLDTLPRTMIHVLTGTQIAIYLLFSSSLLSSSRDTLIYCRAPILLVYPVMSPQDTIIIRTERVTHTQPYLFSNVPPYLGQAVSIQHVSCPKRPVHAIRMMAWIKLDISNSLKDQLIDNVASNVSHPSY